MVVFISYRNLDFPVTKIRKSFCAAARIILFGESFSRKYCHLAKWYSAKVTTSKAKISFVDERLLNHLVTCEMRQKWMFSAAPSQP